MRQTAPPPEDYVTHATAWNAVIGDPAPHLRPYVGQYQGYEEREPLLACNLEVPSTQVVLIINFGAPYRVFGPGNRESRDFYQSFAAGLTDAYVLVQAQGLARGMQVNFTPIGAHLFFGMPMDEIANRALRMDDVLGAAGERLSARLEDTPEWSARFAILDGFIGDRIGRAAAPADGVLRAWDILRRRHGEVSIDALASDVGWSRKHLGARFREQVGLPPKTIARIMRFQRAVAMLGVAAPAAEVAHAAGYYDQAHFNHDFRAFTGVAPRDFAARSAFDGARILAG